MPRVRRRAIPYRDFKSGSGRAKLPKERNSARSSQIVGERTCTVCNPHSFVDGRTRLSVPPHHAQPSLSVSRRYGLSPATAPALPRWPVDQPPPLPLLSRAVLAWGQLRSKALVRPARCVACRGAGRWLRGGGCVGSAGGGGECLVTVACGGGCVASGRAVFAWPRTQWHKCRPIKHSGSSEFNNWHQCENVSGSSVPHVCSQWAYQNSRDAHQTATAAEPTPIHCVPPLSLWQRLAQRSLSREG